VRVRRKSSRPCNVAVGGGVVRVFAFGEGPFGAGEVFAQGEEVGGDVGVCFGEVFFAVGELVHEHDAEVGFFGGEIDGGEFGFAEAGGGFPTDLAAEAGFVAGGAEVGEAAEEDEEGGFEEMPVGGAESE